MWKKVLIGLLVVVALLLLVGAALPRTWKVERSLVIAAPAATIHPWIDDLKRWPEWAAWNKEMDPAVKWTYSGPAKGVGASWQWDGPVMGHGAMTITRSEPDKGVWIDEKIEGDEVNAHGSLTFAPDGAGTKVTWRDEGTLPPVIGGYFRGYIEGMLGDHFAKGLQKLKGQVEKGAPPEKDKGGGQVPATTP